jgi:hypothetical protein
VGVESEVYEPDLPRKEASNASGPAPTYRRLSEMKKAKKMKKAEPRTGGPRSIYMEDELWDRARAEAAKRGFAEGGKSFSVSRLVCELLEKELKDGTA